MNDLPTQPILCRKGRLLLQAYTTERKENERHLTHNVLSGITKATASTSNP
jgi:hypothetical protein